jgi:hypothetical protein
VLAQTQCAALRCKSLVEGTKSQQDGVH